MILTKLRVARQRVKKTTGSCEGRKAYGVRPGEQAVLDRMRELQSKGLSSAALTRQLNAEGLRTRSGGVWFPATVSRILERHT